jgi:hypothetical protein
MMSEFEATVLADLSVLKSQMASLLEGSTGRLSVLEADVVRNRTVVERAKGFVFAFGLLFTVAQLVVDWLRR